jgi:protein-arginine kinase activator protein McsA
MRMKKKMKKMIGEQMECEKCGKKINGRYEGMAWCSDCYKKIIQEMMDRNEQDDPTYYDHND